jgi:acetolactate synthase-1/2/3 large subunit
MRRIAGGQLIAQILAAHGVEQAFGLPDGTYLALLTGFRSQGIRLLTPRHESTAAHMAGAYARLTGRLGVCLASNGPGVANVLPGVAVENAEGNRVLLLTSSRRSPITYPDRGGAYQCFDQVGVTGAMTKWSVLVPSAGRLQELLLRALRLSCSGRPGVVHLDVPEDVINGEAQAAGQRPAPPSGILPQGAEPRLVEQAADLLLAARLPIIHAGGGVLHAAAWAQTARLAEMLHVPVLTSWSGRGAVVETSPLAWPMPLIKACDLVRNAADLVLCLGSRLGETDFWGKPPSWRSAQAQSLIRVDVDDQALGLNRAADLPIHADVGAFLRQLGDLVAGRGPPKPPVERLQLVERLARERERLRSQLNERLKDRSTPMLTAHVPVACQEVFDQDAVAVFDGGNTSVWSHFYHRVLAPNSLLGTPHFGHLGAGLGQALGAAAARPGKQVYCIIGDGAFGFHMQEVETAVRHGLRVVFVVICDRQWGMVKMSEQFALKPVKAVLRKSLRAEEMIATELGEIAFDKLGQAMGAFGLRVADPRKLRPALRACLESGKCAVLHVDVDPVKHLWAPGLQDFKRMHQEPAARRRASGAGE